MSGASRPAPEHIGGGAMGALCLARDGLTGRAVAIKTLALGLTGDEAAELRVRFAREAEAARRLRHPGIVAVLDRGEDRGLAWPAMEHLPGHDLTAHLTEPACLPLLDVLDIGAQIAEALAYAHAQGVVHRDIKPANVVLDAATRRVKLTDFGVARVAGTLRTRTGMVLRIVFSNATFLSPWHPEHGTRWA